MNELANVSFNEIMKMAETIKNEEDILPKECIGKPVKIACIIQAGFEIGVSALTALRCICFVCGKLFFGYDLRVTCIRKSGCKIRWKESTDKSAEVELWFNPDKSDLSAFRFTIEDARKMRLDKKPEWIKQPKTMLRARCISLAARSFIGDWTGYDPSEMDEIKRTNTVEHNVYECETGKEKLLNVLKSKRQQEHAGIEVPEDAPAIEYEEEILSVPKAQRVEHEPIVVEPEMAGAVEMAAAMEMVANDSFSVSINQPVEKLTTIDFKSMINSAKTKHDLRMVSSKITLCKKLTEEEKVMLRQLYREKTKEIGEVLDV